MGFFKSLFDSEHLCEEIIRFATECYFLIKKNNPRENENIWLAKSLKARLTFRNLSDLEAFQITHPFSLLPYPQNVRALGIFIISKENFSLLEKNQKYIIEFASYIEPYFNEATRSEQLEKNEEMFNSPEFQEEVLRHEEKSRVNATDEDQLPTGYGEFGICDTNPIPILNVQSEAEYLNSVRWGNKAIKFKRIGCINSTDLAVTNAMIDMFEIYYNGTLISTFYLCPYHKKNSNRVPDGFNLINP